MQIYINIIEVNQGVEFEFINSDFQ